MHLSHNLIEAFLRGAVAHIVVDGDWNNDLMKQISSLSTIK
jgi:nitrite reductase (NO-forming)